MASDQHLTQWRAKQSRLWEIAFIYDSKGNKVLRIDLGSHAPFFDNEMEVLHRFVAAVNAMAEVKRHRNQNKEALALKMPGVGMTLEEMHRTEGKLGILSKILDDYETELNDGK